VSRGGRRRWGHGTLTERGPGVVQIRLRIGDGDRPTRTFRAKTTELARKAAEAWARQTLAKVDEGSYQRPLTITVGEWVSEWLETTNPTRPPSTQRSYRWAVQKLIPPLYGVLLARLRPSRVQRWINDLGAAGYSVTSCNVARTVLSLACKAAIADELIRVNPVATVTLPEKVWLERSVWTAAQAERFLVFVESDELALFWLLLLATGTRQGELRGLLWQNVDLEQRLLHIYFSGETLQPTKNRRRRTIRLDGYLTGILADEHVRQGKPKMGHVFTRSGKPLRGEYVRRRFVALVSAAGLPPMTPHGCRHTCASILKAKGIDLKEIQELLGHSSLTITADLYTHVPGERLSRVVGAATQALRPLARGEDKTRTKP
jgi:integrase